MLNKSTHLLQVLANCLFFKKVKCQMSTWPLLLVGIIFSISITNWAQPECASWLAEWFLLFNFVFFICRTFTARTGRVHVFQWKKYLRWINQPTSYSFSLFKKGSEQNWLTSYVAFDLWANSMGEMAQRSWRKPPKHSWPTKSCSQTAATVLDIKLGEQTTLRHCLFNALDLPLHAVCMFSYFVGV